MEDYTAAIFEQEAFKNSKVLFVLGHSYEGSRQSVQKKLKSLLTFDDFND
jgi:hypothetical protein